MLAAGLKAPAASTLAYFIKVLVNAFIPKKGDDGTADRRPFFLSSA